MDSTTKQESSPINLKFIYFPSRYQGATRIKFHKLSQCTYFTNFPRYTRWNKLISFLLFFLFFIKWAELVENEFVPLWYNACANTKCKGLTLVTVLQTFGDELCLVTSWQRGFTELCWTVQCFLKANSHFSNYSFSSFGLFKRWLAALFQLPDALYSTTTTFSKPFL